MEKRIYKDSEKGENLSFAHKSVLQKEAVYYLHVKKNSIYIDATVGGGGHAQEIIKLGGKVIGIDRDEDAIEHLRRKDIGGLTLICENFVHIKRIAQSLNIKSVSGILLDLGVSSHQLDEASRGFSFKKDGPLDMRMDKKIKITANDLVNNLEKRRLNEIIGEYGQEKLSMAIADAISSAREVKPITTTGQLANIVREVYARKKFRSKLDEATKTFQALRIVTNSELLNLEETLPQTVELLETGGRLVVISFHSLEDGIVKRFLKQEKNLKLITKTPIGPTIEEVEANPRSRSAKLRAAEKT